MKLYMQTWVVGQTPPWMQTTDPRRQTPDSPPLPVGYVNKRVVCILLECILVKIFFHSVQNALGPAYNEFGYKGHPVVTSRFCCLGIKNTPFQCMLGYTPQVDSPWSGTTPPPSPVVTAADDTHPTGMQSCFTGVCLSTGGGGLPDRPPPTETLPPRQRHLRTVKSGR